MDQRPHTMTHEEMQKVHARGESVLWRDSAGLPHFLHPGMALPSPALLVGHDRQKIAQVRQSILEQLKDLQGQLGLLPAVGDHEPSDGPQSVGKLTSGPPPAAGPGSAPDRAPVEEPPADEPPPEPPPAESPAEAEAEPAAPRGESDAEVLDDLEEEGDDAEGKPRRKGGRRR
jgi:hypothetical protein